MHQIHFTCKHFR